MLARTILLFARKKFRPDIVYCGYCKNVGTTGCCYVHVIFLIRTTEHSYVENAHSNGACMCNEYS
jgi:hypothetical protein